MAPPKAEKTVHGVELQPPPGQDANGITIGQWSSPVIPEEPEGFMASNVSMEACCPCVPLAQIEVRLGLTSYVGALSWYAAAYGLLTLALVAVWVLVALWIYSQAYRDATSVLSRILWLLGVLILTAIPSLLLVHRISTLRSSVREQFDIPGSVREDRTAAWQETARAIRQMRRHLKIDNAKCGPVSTLPAYVV
ncbi:PLAC8 family protein [Phytophthora palmivora]|uniref:PLAC8 family protein n=1 Tax=Phytophthora palmivora TaxID=4796 RepID=A0A2P4XTE1_9STRA|nr:PLAC8 family protein [Phytophthora palmivora]